VLHYRSWNAIDRWQHLRPVCSPVIGEDEKKMRLYVKSPAFVSIAIGLVVSSVATAGSITTFHQSRSHSAHKSRSGSASTTAKNRSRGTSVVQNAPSDPVEVPAKPKANSKSGQSGDKTVTQAPQKTAKRSGSARGSIE